MSWWETSMLAAIALITMDTPSIWSARAGPRLRFRLKPIQLSKQMLDLERLQLSQGKFVLYAL
ncbi:hypothetical protein BCY88_01210 [Paraburkholderia fungorum]|uniref:Uncharacterized protein n=2 Tax=Paraburkholderia fungorum TaxID=134537 RepID=A0A3R7EAF3_9BURK|nr:hypothetical protein BCY88_01210 [Paraburkholderia fungorum]